MEHWRRAGGRNLAQRAAGQGTLHRAKFLGYRLRLSSPDRRDCAAAFQLAGSVFRRCIAGADYLLDSEKSTGIGNVGAAARGFTCCRHSPCRAPARPGGFLLSPFLPLLRPFHAGPAAGELLRPLRLVGTVHLDSAVPIPACFTRRTRLWRDEYHRPAHVPESGRNVSRISDFRLGSRPPWPPQWLCYLHLDGGIASATLRHGALGMAAARARRFGRLLRDRILFRIRDYRQRNLSHPAACSSARLYL